MELPHFGRYRTLSRLGAGAAGEVWRAHDEMLARDVAIKTIPRVGRNASLSLERFFHEARAVAALSHPGVIRVFDMGEQDGTPYLVMELAHGGSLRDRLADGKPVSLDEVCALGIQIAQALAAAHARGIVHRDVKPANVLRDDDGTWRLADFGVAHVPDSTLTLTGQFLGSPAYAAPESLERGDFAAASDIWGLGATLYEALVGEPPWGDRDYAQILAAIDGEPPRVSERAPAVPAAVATAVDRALSKYAGDRPDAAALAAALAGAMSTSGRHEAVAPEVASRVDGGGAATDVALAAAATPPAAYVAPVRRPTATAAATTANVRTAAWSWKTIALIGGGAALLVGLIAATAGRDREEAARGAPAASTAPAGLAVPARAPVEGPFERPAGERLTVQTRDEQHARQWRKIQDKLRKGDGKHLCKEIDKLLARYPDDLEARQLWVQYCGGDDDD